MSWVLFLLLGKFQFALAFKYMKKKKERILQQIAKSFPPRFYVNILFHSLSIHQCVDMLSLFSIQIFTHRQEVPTLQVWYSLSLEMSLVQFLSLAQTWNSINYRYVTVPPPRPAVISPALLRLMKTVK